MVILLVAGLWLDGSAWDAVVPRLRDLGHDPVALSLPGQGAAPPFASLEDQQAAMVAAVDAATGPVLVVGHSAACTLAWMTADARPERVARVALIGGFPTGDGQAYADVFPIRNRQMPFPGWEPFDGPDAADLDESQRKAIAAHAIPVPERVARGTVTLRDERRYGVPVTLICPEFSPAQARQWIDAGEIPELSRAQRLDLVDIDSGHWPMFSRPKELADLLGQAATLPDGGAQP